MNSKVNITHFYWNYTLKELKYSGDDDDKDNSMLQCLKITLALSTAPSGRTLK